MTGRIQLLPVDPEMQRVISIKQAFETQVEEMKKRQISLGDEGHPEDIRYEYEMLGTKFSLADWHVIYVRLEDHAPALRYFIASSAKRGGWYRLCVFDFRFANLPANKDRYMHVLTRHPLVYPDCLEGFVSKLGTQFFGHATVRYDYEYELELRPPS